MIKKKQPKEKINIMGNKYKVEKPISDTLKALSDALHAHEVALLTWVHKIYNAKNTKAQNKQFSDSFYEYCMRIPEAQNIIKRMTELDQQLEEDVKKKKKEDKKQNKKEKVKGAKE